MEAQVTDTQDITADDGYKEKEAQAVQKEQSLQASPSHNEEDESEEEEDIQQIGLKDDGRISQTAFGLAMEKDILTSRQETPEKNNIVKKTNNVETIGRVIAETTEDEFTTDGIVGDDGGDTENACGLEKESKSVTSSAQESPAENNIVERTSNVDATGRVIEDDTSKDTFATVGIVGETSQIPCEKQSEEVDGLIIQHSPPEPEQQPFRGGSRLLIGAVFILLVAIFVHLLYPKSPPENSDALPIDIFLRQLEKMKTSFPNQRPDLWKRSQIHLQRHLQTDQPTEPVSLILTAGLKGETTLHCLAHRLGSAFSTALNASVLHIDGASKASQDSDQVKLDIDSQLQSAFDGNKPVAIINRFEELPPGSTLIFYRYCDHENAAFKKSFLIFTVLLAREEEIPPQMSLNAVEEMVDDYLQTRFLSYEHPVAFDRMDINKYGGLWSRISHLILPVAAEAAVEHEGC